MNMERITFWLGARGSGFRAAHSPQPRAQNVLKRGQSMLEYAVLIAAVASALILMSDYVRKAFNAHAEAIEEELNGATEDNKP